MDVKWCQLENSTASAWLKQHGFKNKPNGNNISLCGRIIHIDSNEIDELLFSHIKDEGMHKNCCKNCLKVFLKNTK